MGRCGTCRFFGPENGIYLSYEGGPDDGPAITAHHACVRIIHGNGSRASTVATELAAVTDGSGYAAKLNVLPDFGCVLHEPKGTE